MGRRAEKVGVHGLASVEPPGGDPDDVAEPGHAGRLHDVGEGGADPPLSQCRHSGPHRLAIHGMGEADQWRLALLDHLHETLVLETLERVDPHQLADLVEVDPLGDSDHVERRPGVGVERGQPELDELDESRRYHRGSTQPPDPAILAK